MIGFIEYAGTLVKEAEKQPKMSLLLAEIGMSSGRIGGKVEEQS